MARVADFPFCIDWLPDGRMLVITGSGTLLRREPDADLAPFVRLESPFPWNDIAVDRRGNAFVRAGGEVLRRIALDRGGFDCVVGDGVLYAVTAVYPSAAAQGQLVAVDL